MPSSSRPASQPLSTSALLLGPVLLLATLSGCKAKPVVDDASLAASIQNQLAGDGSLSGQPVQATVQNGVATLNGNVLNDAQRTIAARDAAGVVGVKEVVNRIIIQPLQGPLPAQTAVAPAPLPLAPAAPLQQRVKPSPAYPAYQPTPQQPQPSREPAPIDRAYNRAPAPVQAPAPLPPPPPRPAFRNVTLASGSTLPVRVTQTLDSETTQQGDTFAGVLTADVLVDGAVALPSGTAVTGRVDAVQEAAHFKGASLLTVSLTSISRRGDRVPVSTDPYTVEGKGRGKNTAEKTGGGAAVGAILGGIFGGGKGAAIGAGAGAGVGAGANAITRGQQVQIPSESVVRFRTTTDVPLRIRTGDQGPGNGPGTGPDGLQPRYQ